MDTKWKADCVSVNQAIHFGTTEYYPSGWEVEADASLVKNPTSYSSSVGFTYVFGLTDNLRKQFGRFQLLVTEHSFPSFCRF